MLVQFPEFSYNIDCLSNRHAGTDTDTHACTHTHILSFTSFLVHGHPLRTSLWKGIRSLPLQHHQHRSPPPPRLRVVRFQNPECCCSVFYLANFLLLPLNTWVLWLGTRPTVSTAKPTTTDIFTCNLAAMEIINSFEMFCKIIGHYLNVVVLMVITVVENGLITFGRSLFHCCTCLERNLVVVHPVA